MFNGFTHTTSKLTTYRVYKANSFIDSNSTNILSNFVELDPLLRGITFTSLFKRSIIIENNIKFDSKINLFEDMIFKYDYLQYCRKIICMNSVGYHYVFNPESLANKKRNVKEFLSIRELVYIKERQLLSKFKGNKKFDKFSKQTYFSSCMFKIVKSTELNIFDKIKNINKVLSHFISILSFIISPIVLICFSLIPSKILLIIKKHKQNV